MGARKGEKNGGGRDFVKGQSGNPNGRPKLPEDIKAASKLTRASLEAIINKYMGMDKDQLGDVVKAKGTPVIELMIASIIHKALVHGDQQRLDFMLNRLIGRVKEQVEISVPKPTIIERSDGTEVIMGVEKRELEE